MRYNILSPYFKRIRGLVGYSDIKTITEINTIQIELSDKIHKMLDDTKSKTRIKYDYKAIAEWIIEIIQEHVICNNKYDWYIRTEAIDEVSKILKEEFNYNPSKREDEIESTSIES